MKDKYLQILVTIAVASLFWLITHYGCQRDCKPEIIRDTTYVYDTIPRIDTLPVPVPYAVIEVESIPVHISDTLCRELYMNYYSSLLYHDTLRNDSLALIILNDTVSRNKLSGRTLYYIDRTPTQVITNTFICPENRWRFYAGISPGFGRNNGFGVSAILQRSNMAYGYTYDVVNQQHYLSMYFSIIKGKRGN